MERERIEWLDGVKGLAALLIFLHHFCLAFYPAIHYGAASVSHWGGKDVAFSDSPLSFFLNGNYMVTIFCAISGLVISNSVFAIREKEKIADLIVKRYFRLALPLIPIGFIAYFLLKYDLFQHLQTAQITGSQWLTYCYVIKPDFCGAIKSMLFNVWFLGDNTLSTAFWMLSQLFYGTFISIILSLVSWKAIKRGWVIYIVVALCYMDSTGVQMAFVLGTLLSWIYQNKSCLFKCKLMGIMLILLGVFLGGYPSGVKPENVYLILSFKPYVFWHILGAFFTLYGIFCVGDLRKVFAGKIFRFLGKISYAIYLIHIPLLFGGTTRIFNLALKRYSYHVSVSIALVISVIVLVLLAFFYNKMIEQRCVIIQNKILEKIMK